MAIKNALHDYQTYSYHHVLAICANSTVAEQLANSPDLANFTQSNPKYQSRNVDETPKLIADGNTAPYSRYNEDGTGYVILIDGRTDAEFSISTVKWTNIIAPNIGTMGEEYYTTMAVEGEMEIIEPKGVRLLNVISNSVRKLSIDPASAVYLLKTIFVGHRHDGRTEVIPSIKPLLFIGYDIQASFESIGARYTLSFVAMSNGAAKLPHMNTGSPGLNITIPRGATLKDALKTVEKQLNQDYQAHLKNVQTILGPKVKTKGLQYFINVDAPYSNSSYVIDGIKETVNDEGDANSPFPISFGEGATVESCINRIMELCSKVIEEKDGADGKRTRLAYKVISTVDITADVHKVIFKVVRYPMPTTSLLNKLLAKDPTTQLPNQVLELDYYFTGKNVDILSMDIRMAMGLPILQMMYTTDAISDATNNINKQTTSSASGQGNATSDDTDIQQRTVTVFFGTNIKDAMIRDKKRQMSLAKFKAMLRRFSSLEGLETKVVIAGNPVFLNSLVRMPSDIAKDASAVEDSTLPFANFEAIPAFCTIDIKMLNEETSIPETFWYDGYYYIFSVENSFDEGMFTQTLEMMSLPQDLEDTSNEDTK